MSYYEDPKAPPAKHFKIGDKIVIKPLEMVTKINKKTFFEYSFCDGMYKYCGKEAVIEYIEDEDDGEIRFYLDIDEHEFMWTRHMFMYDNNMLLNNE